MATTQSWTEYNGATAGTATTARTDCNWKATDTSTNDYGSNPITAGLNSYCKQQALVFAGSANSLSALSFYISAATGTGWTVKAGIVTTAATAVTTATGDATMPTAAGTLNGTFGTSSTPWSSAGGSSVTSISGTPSMYASTLRTQLQTTGSAAPGDITSLTITASWTES